MGWLEIIKTKLGLSADEHLNPSNAPVYEWGRRGTTDSQLRVLYESMLPPYDLYNTILEVRRMDRLDGQVKMLHNRIAKSLTKGGLQLDNPTNDKRLNTLWRAYVARTELDKRQKLISDARGLIVEGNLVLQWVLNTTATQVMRSVRMPAETIRPLVAVNGQFVDPAKAYAQYSFLDGKDLAFFARWQMDVARLDPDNYDDFGSLGRPLLDANRKRWRQINMTTDDMVVRRRHRAALRTAHVLKGASDAQLTEYKKRVEAEEKSITTNYYSNVDGAVTALQGDANLDQIADVSLLLDAFFAGTPMPKALLGYVSGLNRDVLEDMKREFYDDLDALQDLLADSYLHGFKLELLLNGLNPDSLEFTIQFAERLTETLTQRTDRALKVRALGASQHTAWSIAGLDPTAELERLEDERASLNPYPNPDIPTVDDELDGSAAQRHAQKITITPDNAAGKESATSIKNG
ncbi:hypothetical protein [Thiolinea disciformis]|uniref:hypothetical protein n=1 Tax=Thiolinea disciformis TaxID=125614 RepID=UPI000366F50C|nr:hypothetical protein [Thiolinea disciformis]